MVDFQSRETRRGAGDATADEPEATDEAAEPDADPGDRLGFAVVAVGDELSVEDDPAGDAAIEALAGDDVEVVTREVIGDSYDGVQSAVAGLVDRADVDVVLTVGGTGVEPGDVTVEAIEALLDKALPGVGELVRRRCEADYGTGVIRTRATGGVIEGVPIFCLPGDPALADRATREIIVPEAGPLVELAAVEPEAS